MSPEKVEFDANLIPIQQNEAQWELTSVLTVMLCICQPFFSCIVIIFQPDSFAARKMLKHQIFSLPVFFLF